MLLWRSWCAKSLFISFLKSFLFKGKKESDSAHQRKTNQSLQKKKNPSLFLKPELSRGQGGLRATGLLPHLEKECGPESTLRLPGWDLGLPQPINTPNDALNKSPSFESCFLFSFHVVLPVKRSKHRGYFFSPQSGGSSLKWMCFFLLLFFSSFRKSLYNQRLTVNFPNTSPFTGACGLREAEAVLSFLGVPSLVFHLMRAIGWALLCPGWLRTTSSIHQKHTKKKTQEFSWTEK